MPGPWIAAYEWTTAAAWLVAALIALAAARALAGRERRAWSVLAAGLAYLAIDERFSLHEKLGVRLWEWGVPTPPGVSHLDDVVAAGIGLAGFVFLCVFARTFARHRVSALLIAAGAVSCAAAVAWDALAPLEPAWSGATEESLELLGAALMLAAAWGRRLARPPRPAAALVKLQPHESPDANGPVQA